MERTINDIIREAEEDAGCPCISQCEGCNLDICANCDHYFSKNFVDNYIDTHRDEM